MKSEEILKFVKENNIKIVALSHFKWVTPPYYNQVSR